MERGVDATKGHREREGLVDRLSNRKIKVFSHVAAAVICFAFFLLAFWIYQKGIDRAAEQAAERVMEEMRQQAAEGQEGSGSVTIYKNDGTVWGYFGEVTVVSDGSDGSQPQIELHGAWLVGSTAEEYQMEGGE